MEKFYDVLLCLQFEFFTKDTDGFAFCTITDDIYFGMRSLFSVYHLDNIYCDYIQLNLFWFSFNIFKRYYED